MDRESLFLGGIMEELIMFIFGFVFIFVIYQVFIVSKAKKNKSKRGRKKEPAEIVYLKKVYKDLDFKKIPYNQLLQIIAIISSFDISLIVSIILCINNFFLKLLIGLISTIIIVLTSYHLVYLFYKKKGMVKNV